MNDSADMDKGQNAERDKTADDLAATRPILSSSICLKCVSHRTIVSGKGSGAANEAVWIFLFNLLDREQTKLSVTCFASETLRIQQ